MIFCITLFQRAASRVKKRQSGAEDPHLRAACVNRGFVPLSSTVPSSPRYRAAWSAYHAWESGCFTQQAKWYRGVMPLPWQAGAKAFVFGV